VSVVLADKSLGNLFSLYRAVSKRNPKAFAVENRFCSYVGCEGSVWPNLFFDFTVVGISQEVCDCIKVEIEERKLASLLIMEENKLNLELLKKNGFFPVDKWVGMTLDLPKQYKSTGTMTGVALEEVGDNGDIDLFLEVVSAELFSGKTLERSVFASLISTGQKLYLLKVEQEVVGAAMTFFDHSGCAGLYMFCIRKPFQRNGLGKEFLDLIISRLSKQGYDKLVLQATKSGFPFYLKSKFEVIQNYYLLMKLK